MPSSSVYIYERIDEGGFSMSNKLLLTFALIGIIVVFSCGLLLPMPIGFKVSMITAGVMMIVMFSIIIPFDRKHIVRKMDIELILRKQKYIFAGMYLIRFRLVLQCMHAYVQALNILVSTGQTIQNPYVQFLRINHKYGLLSQVAI